MIETNRFLTPETEAAYITWKAEKEQQKLVEAREKLVADAEKKHSGEIAVLQEPEQEETDNRVVVAQKTLPITVLDSLLTIIRMEGKESGTAL